MKTLPKWARITKDSDEEAGCTTIPDECYAFAATAMDWEELATARPNEAEFFDDEDRERVLEELGRIRIPDGAPIWQTQVAVERTAELFGLIAQSKGQDIFVHRPIAYLDYDGDWVLIKSDDAPWREMLRAYNVNCVDNVGAAVLILLFLAFAAWGVM